jgi:hypothetical protein
MEVAPAFPFGIPSLFNVVRFVALGKFSDHGCLGAFSAFGMNVTL